MTDPALHANELPEEVVEGKRLGRHVLHDERSRDYPVIEALDRLRAIGTSLGKIRAWYRNSVWDQNQPGSWNGNQPESSCTVQATGGCLVTMPYTRVLKPSQKKLLYSPDFRYRAYRRAQQLDPWPGEEPSYYGSSGLAACKALVELKAVPANWEYRWAFGGDEAMRALRYASISVGTEWLSGFDNPDRHGRVKLEGHLRGGHQWQIIDEEDEYVIGLNSWGRSWGKNGRFAMLKKSFYELLERDGDVVVWVPGAV